jgi:N-acetylglucosaminyl-diphospho-decaprenol L-rhamnosyltransferase
MADWTVVTVTYNSAETLRRCWRAPRDFDWLVVDNASADDSAAVAASLGARVIRLTENAGFAAANNVGADASSSPYLLFANPDLMVADGLDRLREHLDTYGGIAAPQLLGEDGTPQPNGRGFPYVTAKLGNRRLWPFSRLHDGYRILAGPGEARWVAWAIGAAVAVRRTDFEAIGGWNERFFVYYEDADLGLRSWRHDRPVAVVGDVRWVHLWRRATNTLQWNAAHNHEVRAARTFYRMYPEFVLGVPRPRGRHARAASCVGLPCADALGPIAR